VLAFAARRLLAEPVGLIFAAREPGEQFRGLAELEVRGLPVRLPGLMRDLDNTLLSRRDPRPGRRAVEGVGLAGEREGVDPGIREATLP